MHVQTQHLVATDPLGFYHLDWIVILAGILFD